MHNQSIYEREKTEGKEKKEETKRKERKESGRVLWVLQGGTARSSHCVMVARGRPCRGAWGMNGVCKGNRRVALMNTMTWGIAFGCDRRVVSDLGLRVMLCLRASLCSEATMWRRCAR